MSTFICNWYSKCPVCYKCMNAAPHMYSRCRQCAYGQNKCADSEKRRDMLIKRHNFKLNLTPESKENIKKLGDRSEQEGNSG